MTSVNPKKKKLSRMEAQVLADFARTSKGIDLPGGWTAFWRLDALQIHAKYPSLSIAEIVKESRMKVDVEVEA